MLRILLTTAVVAVLQRRVVHAAPRPNRSVGLYDERQTACKLYDQTRGSARAE
jgi:hypothetical protein